MPLVFFLDELDRCRPTYAIELLETVKHLFGVEGVVFILGINREALSLSFQAVYGPKFEGNTYLRRFIDLPYYLPDPPLAKFCDVLAEEFIPPIFLALKKDAFYYASLGFDNEAPYRRAFAVAAAHFARRFGRSLRDLEQIFSRAGAALGTLPKDQHVEPAYFAYLMLLHDAAPDKYKSFRDGTLKRNLVDELKDTPYPVDFRSDQPIEVIVEEALNTHHLPRNRLEEHLYQYADRVRVAPPNDHTALRWVLLRNDRQRLLDAPKLVDFAQQFTSEARAAVSTS